MQGPIVDSWKERLPELLSGFASDDNWNIDETELFWKALGGKKVKERFTVAYFVTAAGKKKSQ